MYGSSLATQTVCKCGGGDSTAVTARASVALALGALAFTLLSFWWMNVRSGRLRGIGEPRSYAFGSGGDRYVLTLPVVLANSGPTPIVAINLRLRCLEGPFAEVTTFVATRESLTRDEGRELATAIVLTGRDAKLCLCEFQGPLASLHLDRGTTAHMRLEGFTQRPRRRPSWVELLTFDVRIPAEAVVRPNYLAYDNNPG
jgi:hypothetical protein